MLKRKPAATGISKLTIATLLAVAAAAAMDPLQRTMHTARLLPRPSRSKIRNSIQAQKDRMARAEAKRIRRRMRNLANTPLD